MPPRTVLGVVWQQMSSDALWDGWQPSAGSARGGRAGCVAPWQTPALDLQEHCICVSLLHSAEPKLRVLITSWRGAQP